ncbi:MAG: diguanylate cyclase [Deltaproteobacteria bacterium]|nr:diguanylate cyclase [Deltaproteobacteria bacterium]
MRETFPDDSFLALQAEITPELAKTCSEKMNLLFQVQLLGRSVDDVDAALTLLMDLARDLVPCERGALLWWNEGDETLDVRVSRGFDSTLPASFLREAFYASGGRSNARPVLVSGERSGSEALDLLQNRLRASSLLLMPLYAAHGVMGALVLLRDGSAVFQREEAHLLRVFTFSFEGVLDAHLHCDNRRDLTYSDPLTGLFNRRYFDQKVEREIERARRSNHQVSVFLVALDDFHRFRQRHGRPAGEALLRGVSSALGRTCRKFDTLARFREDAFALILPGAQKRSLRSAVERVFQSVTEALQRDLPGGSRDVPSCSVSGVSYPEDGVSPEALIEACSQGLEKARSIPGRHYHQWPARDFRRGEEDVLDPVRTGVFREPLLEPGKLLELFCRLCLDAVPADRISIMLDDGDSLAVRVALGFDGREEVVQSLRLPLTGHTVSAWVAQRRQPLLVRNAGEMRAVTLPSDHAYKNDSFFSFPLLDGERLLGVVHFSNRSDGEPFSEKDVDRFRPLAQVMERYIALYRSFGSSQEAFLREALALLVSMMEAQVPGMECHSEEVAHLAEKTARELGYEEKEAARLAVSSRLHNLGNVSLRAGALAQPRALNAGERAMSQRHPLLGWRFLKDVPLGPIDREAILYHHEREDGSGYFGKKGAETPETAKILGAADVYKAITSPRPYRPAVSKEAALQYLEGQKGKLFDGRVIDALKVVLQGT